MKANETSGNISATSDDSLFDQPSVAEDTSIADDSILNFTTSVSPFSATSTKYSYHKQTQTYRLGVSKKIQVSINPAMVSVGVQTQIPCEECKRLKRLRQQP